MKTLLRILWLKSGPLHPLDTGGKIRTYNMLRELKRNHEITFLALCPPDTTEAARQMAREFSHRQIWIPWKETPKHTLAFFIELACNGLFSKNPYVIQKYRSSAMVAKIRELDSSNEFDLIVCDFLTPASNLPARTGAKRTALLLFQHNVESSIWERLFRNAKGRLKRIYFKSQWERMERFELETCRQCDAVVGVSDDDGRVFQSQFGLTNVLGSVPTGVDLSYFRPTTERRKPHSLVFLGSMDWMPNIDAVSYFTEKIFPAVKEKFPDATLKIVGRNPTRPVKELEKIKGISVTGSVADVRPHLAEAEVMIVPLRIGGGTRIKIYEGMATGIPVISSRIGAEGLPVIDRENILLVDSPADFSTAIGVLFGRSDLRKQIGDAGRVFVERNFGWESVTKVFEHYCRETLKRKNQISA